MKRERLNKFSIRKLTVGAASVLIGVAFGATTVSATGESAGQQAGTPTTVTPKKDNPTDPKKDNPTDPKKDNPADPKKDNPTDPKKDNPTDPKKDNPTDPKKDNPTDPKKDNPTDPKKDNPTDPKKDNPTDPKKDNPADPKKDNPTDPKKDNPTDPKKDTPAGPKKDTPVVSGETGIGYLDLDTLFDSVTGPVKDSSFTGTLYVPVVGKDVNCKVRLLDDAGKYTNDYVVTDTTIKALASKVVNGVTFYKVAENRWIPAKFAETTVANVAEVAFKGVAKTFVKGHANYAVAMLDANGKYTGKFLKQGSSFKVFAKKVINGHLCYRLGTQAQWVPARFLVF